MNKYFTTLTNERGDVLPNYRAQVVDNTGAVVTIYRDKSGTRFTDSSGNIINYCTAEANGRVSFYFTAEEGQVLQTLDAAGDLVDSEPDFADNLILDNLPGNIPQSAVTDLTVDLAAKAAAADLASTDAGKGASLIGTASGNDLETELALAKASGGNAGQIAPAYIETLDTGLIPDVPDNVRTDLATTTFAGGGYTEELEIAVTGTAGSKVLTTAETTKVAGFGPDPFNAALFNDSEGFFVTARSNNGSTQITLDVALEADFTGTFVAKYDNVNGQHITQGATKAYAHHVAKALLPVSTRGGTIAADNTLKPSALASTPWARNAALVSYGISNSAAPIVQSNIEATTSAANIVAAKVPVRPISLANRGVRVGTHAAGHGAEATFNVGGKSCVLEFWTGAHRSTNALSGTELTVTVTADGNEVYSATHTDNLRRVCVPIYDASEIAASVTNADGGIYYIELSQLSVREVGVGRVLNGKKIATVGDSWFAYYGGAFSTRLAALTGATIVNNSLGGMTTEWALAWFDEYVRDVAPDVAVFHFFTNDANNLTGTFTDPDGASQPLWPSGLTDAQSQEYWRGNIAKLAAKCIEIGVQPVFILPGGTASVAQMQKHAEWRWAADRGAVINGYVATNEEKDSATSLLNTLGKYRGKQIVIGSSQLTAEGSDAADAWSNINATSIEALQKVALTLADYTATTPVIIGTDGDADGLSDGITYLSFGTNETNGEVVTVSIVGGAQRYSVNFTEPNDGQKRMNFPFTTVAGDEYLIFADVENAPSNEIFDALCNVTGSYVTLNISGTNQISGTSGTIYGRGTADASTSRNFAFAPKRSNGVTKAVDVTRFTAVNLTALFADAPNLTDKTELEIIEFVKGLS